MSSEVDSVKTLLATVPAFQTWLGVSTIAAAKAKIFFRITPEVELPDDPDNDADSLPLVIMSCASFASVVNAMGATEHFIESSSYSLTLIQRADTGDENETQETDFLDSLRSIARGIGKLAGTGTHPFVNSIAFHGEQDREPQDNPQVFGGIQYATIYVSLPVQLDEDE